MIQIIGPQFTQWDTGRSVSISDSTATKIHFANQGDSKAVIIDVTDGKAKVPDYLLQTGKTLFAYAVHEGITLETRRFAVAQRERPENYVYEDDTRNYIYELIASAEDAVTNASEAATRASTAADNAAVRANQAYTAAMSAFNSADSANEAANNANEAAAKATQTAKSLMVVGKTQGDTIALDDAIEMPLVGLRVFGKTTQNGVPTPDAPVELDSLGETGGFDLHVSGDHDSHSMRIETPNGLPGIPVASGGNYTDANGQQWISDEIDFARGVYVHRVHLKTLNGSEGWMVAEQNAGGKLFYCYDNDAGNIIERNGLSSIGYVPYMDIDAGGYGLTYAYHFRLRLENMNPNNNTTEELKAYLSANPICVLVSRETPIETPLSTEELAAYNALHTYRGNTTVDNDEFAWMELEYVMDAKKYIDSLAGGGGVSARLSSVTLSASKWAGENSLYSQVVNISGITENSKVDLLPSVEQLAIFFNKNVSFVTENEDGVVTVYAIGDKPTNNYTMQVQITEVLV